MSKIEIILTITAIVSLFTTIKTKYKYKIPINEPKVKVHKCIYNENPKCYECACGYCEGKKECDFCCGSDCDKCPGHRVEVM